MSDFPYRNSSSREVTLLATIPDPNHLFSFERSSTFMISNFHPDCALFQMHCSETKHEFGGSVNDATYRSQHDPNYEPPESPDADEGGGAAAGYLGQSPHRTKENGEKARLQQLALPAWNKTGSSHGRKDTTAFHTRGNSLRVSKHMNNGSAALRRPPGLCFLSMIS